MRLITRQINAVRKAKEQCIEEIDSGGINHFWSIEECPLCKIFMNQEFIYDATEIKKQDICGKCPFNIVNSYAYYGCVKLCMVVLGTKFPSLVILTDILYQFELYLKEIRLEQIKGRHK